jgi:hypothetical protein
MVDHAGNIETSREHSANMKGAFREHGRPIKGITLRASSGDNIWGPFVREKSGAIERIPFRGQIREQ